LTYARQYRIMVPNMVKLRLRRTGGKNQPSYRIVAVDSRAPRDGAFLEILGHYNPMTDPETVVLDNAKASQWLNHGAQPTAAVARLLAKAGVTLDKSKTSEEKA
jgi:small subunit ribosomal protein S16